jgi:hypothetical protein
MLNVFIKVWAVHKARQQFFPTKNGVHWIAARDPVSTRIFGNLANGEKRSE